MSATVAARMPAEAPRLVISAETLRSLSAWLGFTAAAIAAVGLSGWIFGISALKSVVPGLASMKANTALAIILEGVALGLAGNRPRVARLMAALGLGIGVLTLSEFISGASFGIDELIFRDRGEGALPYFPGRMAPTTATCFVLIGLALVMGTRGRRKAAGEAAALAVLLMAFSSLAGYLYGVRAGGGVVAYHTTQMAVHTSVAFFLLASGVLLVDPARGWLGVILADDAGGLIARRLLPAAIGGPVAVGSVFLAGQRAGWYGLEFAVDGVVVVTATLLASAVCAAAARLAYVDSIRRDSEEALRRLNIELESRVADRTVELAAANRELEAFCYAVSHDLASPLQTVDGFAAAIQKDVPGIGEAGASHVKRIRAAAAQMAERMEALLELSRLARAELRREDVDLSAMAAGVAETLRLANPGREVRFTAAPGLVCRGDPRLLRVVLENLVGNAWKFTRNASPAVVEFGGSGREFFVRDNGAGFDPAHAKKLFGVFNRLHSQEQFPGHGVGLATAQRIVLRHGGTIAAEGAPGSGATFRFTI